MTFEEIQEAILNLNDEEQKRLITEIVPKIWGKVCNDDSCLIAVRKLVDEDAVKTYRKQHMNGI